MKLRVLTLNIAHGRKNGVHQILHRKEKLISNLDDIVRVLKKHNPQIVALQEADAASFWSGNFDHVKYIAQRSEFKYWVHGKHVENRNLCYGSAILSTFPLFDSDSHIFKNSIVTMQKGFTIASIIINRQKKEKIDLISLHLDAVSSKIRKKQAKEIIEKVKDRKNNLMIMGDFNVSWKKNNSAVQLIATQLGLKLYFPKKDKTFPTFKKIKRRIDWIMISKQFSFINHLTLPDNISDHFAVFAEININK